MTRSTVPTLSQLLSDRGISLDALAVLSELDTATAYRVANGLVRPRPTTIIRMADALGIGARRMRLICDASWDQAHVAKMCQSDDS